MSEKKKASLVMALIMAASDESQAVKWGVRAIALFYSASLTMLVVKALQAESLLERFPPLWIVLVGNAVATFFMVELAKWGVVWLATVAALKKKGGK